jgi:hypothetical protein
MSDTAPLQDRIVNAKTPRTEAIARDKRDSFGKKPMTAYAALVTLASA